MASSIDFSPTYRAWFYIVIDAFRVHQGSSEIHGAYGIVQRGALEKEYEEAAESIGGTR